jgi:hypothetical protein
MKKSILTFAISLLSLIIYAQKSPEALISDFFTEYATNTNKAIDDLYSTNSWSSRIKDGIDNLKKEINGYSPDYMGKYYGYELITKKQFSQSLILYSYLIKYDRQPLRFVFKFYKPNDKWIVYSFNVDSNIDDELEQAAKLYYLNLEKNN